jgi:hypothetical protein
MVNKRVANRHPASSFIRWIGVALTTSGLVLTSSGQTSHSSSEVTQKARSFLAGLFDPDLGLLPEYRGATVYWLFHDNYLAAKVLNVSHPEMAQSIRSAIEREGIHKSGKIELLFGEAENPLPFRQYQLVDVRRTPSKLIRTEVVTTSQLDDWAQYADLLLLACIAETNPSTARQHWDKAMQFWDGKGFLDAAARHSQLYSTYKLALALIAASRLSPSVKPPDGLIDKLLSLQSDEGGWITDYDATGNRIGVANVETTCISILGIEAYGERGPKPTH